MENEERVIVAPVTTDLAKPDGKLKFWKQILPQKEIHYTAKSGERKTLDFSSEYLQNLAQAFKAKALDKVPFMLADERNAHTMDPERYRGDITDVRLAKDGEEPGLYGLVEFPDAESAKAITSNPGLGVSARIRENVQTSDGKSFKAALIHVLGTLDPQVRGMAGWQPADVSLSHYDGNILDLSSDEKDEDMGKSATAVLDKDKALEDYTDADIDAMDEAQIDAFLAEFAADLTPGDEAKDSEKSETEDKAPAEKSESEEPKAEVAPEAKEEAELSNSHADVELANATAAAANQRAMDALKRMAAAEWKAERKEYEAAGVPGFALDLATPILERADDMEVDLSVTGDEDVNVSTVVRQLLDGYKGTVDLSNEAGHGSAFSAKDGEDPDKAILDNWKI